MATNAVVSHFKENKHIYGDYRNIITLSLWGLALASHAILIPMLVRELYSDFAKRGK